MADFDQETGEIVPVLYRRSADINELFAALAKAQGVFENAEKAGANPHFGSRYATLESVVEATRKGRAENGLAVVQMPGNLGDAVAVTTVLGHASGQWIESVLAVRPSKFDAQGAGSVITYLRRYGMMSVLGVAAEDDDGNAAVAAAPDVRLATRANPAVAQPTDQIQLASAAAQRIRKQISEVQFVEQLNERGINGPAAEADERLIKAQKGGARVWDDLVRRDADRRIELTPLPDDAIPELGEEAASGAIQQEAGPYGALVRGLPQRVLGGGEP